MPLTPWSSQVLCTVADVRARLKSPELPFRLTKADDTPISVTNSGNTITSGIPHGFIQWNLVQFSGTLPSPLVAGTSYYVKVATPTTYTVASTLGGADIALTGNFSNGTAQNYTLDALIQDKINSAKDDEIRQELLVEFQKRIPTLVDTWLTFKRTLIDNIQQTVSRDLTQLSRVSVIADLSPYGLGETFLELLYFEQFYPGIDPLTFVNFGTPDSTTLAGQCRNGAVLIDSANRILYINRGVPNQYGVTAVPDWQYFSYPDAIDRIVNIVEIKTVAVYCTLWLLAVDGAFRNAAGLQWSMDMADWLHNMYVTKLKAVLPLIQVNISNTTNELPDYARRFMESAQVFGVG